MAANWQQHPSNGPPNLSRNIQGLVRDARCYPPEREPRIVRDVYDCSRHFPGLRPHNEQCVIDSRTTMPLLCLNGVIPISYRGVTYQIPVIIWVPPHYPTEAPVPYVRPTASMVLRKRHRNLDNEGRVYLPQYLSIWEPTQFSLYGLVVAMTRIFSAEPPVNSRPSPPAPSQDDPERRRLIAAVSHKLYARFSDVSNEAVAEIGQLLDRKDDIAKRDHSLSAELRASARSHRDALDALRALEARKTALHEWRRDADADADADAGTDAETETDAARNDADAPVDEVLQYRETLLQQIAQSMAEDHAYSDALDQADEAFVKGLIDHETYMKDIRKLSREQFFPRALWKKLDSARLRKTRSEGGGGDAMLQRGNSRLSAPVVPMRSL